MSECLTGVGDGADAEGLSACVHPSAYEGTKKETGNRAMDIGIVRRICRGGC